MSTLIISLPLSPGDATTRYDHVLTADGQTVGAHAASTAAHLPHAGRGVDETVVVVPVTALSWQQVVLPPGIGPRHPRLRPVLQSLLEDRLLDDPDALHLALAPNASAERPAWVAVCDRAWLRQHLHALEAAGHPISRIVPELAPHDAPLHLHVLGAPDAAQLVLSGSAISGGVQHLPLHTDGDALHLALGAAPRPTDTAIWAEPAVAAQAEQVLRGQVQLQQSAQRQLQASLTAWDLAQFELAHRGRARWVKRLTSTGRALLREPEWRAVRWGTALLLMAHLIGLNAWAWQESARWQAQRLAIAHALTETFPRVKVVIDAPVQMAREVALLRQAAGATSTRDLEAMLSALGGALPPGRSADALDYNPGELRLKGLNLTPSELNALTERLRPQGYSTRDEGSNTLLVRQESAP
jgi:general secretion pathway protein L